ncbi:MAG TPA: CPBP family intramembrane metalloprotease [Gemmatales bacterium]|nr:CPBP family intramembrane metalloprotease [Gemmatales bacterium]
MPDSFSSTAQKYLEELKLMASSMALIAIVMGIVLFLIWRRTGIPRQLVGKERSIKVPWDWLEVFLAALIMIYVFEAAVIAAPWGRQKLSSEAYAGFQLGAAASVTQVSVDGGLSGGLLTAAGAIQAAPLELAKLVDDARMRMINMILFFPLVLLLLLNVLKRFCGARLYQLGLHLNHWKENVTLGSVGWAVITPTCFIVLLLVSLSFWETLWGRSSDHPMHTLLTNDPRVFTWILVGVITCVIAPLKEEILMRGIVQPYLVRNPLVSDILIVMGIVWAFTMLMTPGAGPDRGMGLGPLFFVAVAVSGYYLFEKWTQQWIKEPGAARGIYATSLVFATLHMAAWPQPIPIFLFSLGVGFLAYRTRSLVGPITVHLLFNLTTMIMLVLGQYPKFKW